MKTFVSLASLLVVAAASTNQSSRDGSCNWLCWIVRIFLSDSFGDTCVQSSDCADDMYCGNGICKAYGRCLTQLDCRNPENLYPVIECTGPLVCDSNLRCGRECGPTCEDGTEGVSCERLPCDFAASLCSTSDIASCQNDFCGECSALVFDKSGKPEECKISSGTVFCESTSDCDDEDYCSSGMCKQGGECSSEADCFNPDNLYEVIECVGPIGCNEGQCGRTCANTSCPNDEDPVQCLVSPCTAIGLSCNDEIANCVDDYCGGCNAYAFDTAGFEVCQPPIGCESIDDCDHEEYCAGGECLPFGNCEGDLDCFNPSNLYPLPLCIGAVSCSDEGMCGIQCGLSSCPDGKEEAFCTQDPCENVPACEESWKYCTADRCNGDCGVLLFDDAGFEVECTAVALP